jgi:hypothetical protein
VEDRIELSLAGDDELLAAAAAHRQYLGSETLATELELGGGAARSLAPAYTEESEVDGRELRIALRSAGAAG